MWFNPPVIGGMFVNINRNDFTPVYNYLLDKLSDVYQTNKSSVFQETQSENINDEKDLKNQIAELLDIEDDE